MGNHLLHIWTPSFQSSCRNASDADSVLNWLEFDNEPCQRPWRGVFLWRGPETQSTAEVSELPLSWYACYYPQMFDMEPEKWATLITAFLGQNCRGLQGRPIQSIEVALSAVIREFKHSTSLQDDTSLNSLSTHHLPTHLTWLYDMIFLQTINQLPPSLCRNYHAALEPLVTFLYAALFVNIIYLGLYSSKRCLCTIIAEQSWKIV